MYLVTTPIKDLWPDDGPLWMLSESCIPDPFESDKLKKWNIQGCITDPFADGKENLKKYEEIWKLTVEMIEIFTPRLNQIHNTNYDSKYWAIQTGFWFLNYVISIYIKYHQLCLANKAYKDLIVIGCLSKGIDPPTSTHDFIYIARADDAYNTQLYSIIAEEIGMVVQKYDICSKPEIVEKVRQSSHPLYKTILKQTVGLLQSFSIFLFARKADVLMENSYFPRWFQWLLLFWSRGKYVHLDFENQKEVIRDKPVNEQHRKILRDLPPGLTGLKSILIRLVGEYIPKSLVENYAGYSASSKKLYYNFAPKAIFSSNLWYYDEVFLHWAANSIEKKIQLIGGEHGGPPFIGRYEICSRMEILKTNWYATWGWEDSNRPQILATPGTKLVYLNNKKSPPRGDKILYVCTAEPKYAVSSLESFPSYLRWQERFFKNLSPKLVGQFLVRPHYHDFGWKIRERISLSAPGIRFDSWNIPFTLRLKERKARLFVFDYLSTTFCESMALNLPCIIYMDNKLIPVLESMEHYFEMLKKVGILHDSPESAAKWVAEIYDQTNSWFYAEDCQKAVQEFSYYNSRTSKTPMRDWIKIFTKITNTHPDSPE